MKEFFNFDLPFKLRSSSTLSPVSQIPLSVSAPKMSWNFIFKKLKFYKQKNLMHNEEKNLKKKKEKNFRDCCARCWHISKILLTPIASQ